MRRGLLLALLAIFVGRIVLTYRVFNDITDESGHIRAGLEILATGSYVVEAQHPPLSRLVLGVLPYYFSGLHFNPRENPWDSGTWTFCEPSRYWKSLALARAGNLVFALIIFYFVYRWSSRLYGEWSGVAACLLAVCSPNLIAHASLATIDISSAATVLVAAYCFWLWSRQPGLGYCLASSAAFSLAALCKFSGLFFLPPLAIVFFLAARVGRWRHEGLGLVRWEVVRTVATRAAAFVLLFWIAIWAGYLFQATIPPPPGHHAPPLPPPQNLAQRVLRLHLLPPMFSAGVGEILLHNKSGHQAYLLGKFSTSGWWYYFPVVVAVKSTLPLLMLVALGGGLWAWGRYRGTAQETIYPLLAVAVILGVSMAARLNIGVRHILAIYPFLAILGSGLFADRERLPFRPWPVLILATLLAVWHAGESVIAHPDYLAYFNEIARGREERFLLDSNLDWGQDLARLGQYMRARRIDRVHLGYFGKSHPYRFGIDDAPLRAAGPQPGWTAISVNHLMGLDVAPAHFQWLRERKPVGRVGKSIWIYYLPAPESGPGSN